MVDVVIRKSDVDKIFFDSLTRLCRGKDLVNVFPTTFVDVVINEDVIIISQTLRGFFLFG